MNHNHDDYDVKYRPGKLDDVVGQDAAVAVIRAFKGKIPRAVMLTGPTGTGKTTIARIISSEILGVDLAGMDYNEKNCGESSPVDMIREIGDAMSLSAMKAGGKRVWNLDEFQILSRTPQAQNTFLKILENEKYPHVQFILSTTDPQKLLPAIRGRCVKIELKPIKPVDLAKLVDRVARAEGLKINKDLVDRIVANSDGCAREAIKRLQAAAGLEDPEARLAAVSSTAGKDAFELVKALLPFKGQASWSEIAAVLTKMIEQEEDPEGLRQMLLKCARTALLRPNQNPDGLQRAYKVISCLSDPLYDRGSGHALLAAGCYKAVFGSPAK